MAGLRTLRNDKGFTLVELAIVLVIIGILLGGIIKGQELIKNSKMKRLYSTYREVTAATYTYFDRYGRYPGDDNLANTRWAGVPVGNGNGQIGAGGAIFCASGSGGENCNAWRHLRLAGILSGATDATSGVIAPSHAFGGSVAILTSGTAALGINTAANPYIKPFVVCFGGLTNEIARWLDTNYDDAVAATGSVRGSADYMTGGADATSATYVCVEG